ncbi:MAG TPA: hypothetical protein VH640_22565 [Bryobacteraceae bacterium]|jgi:regulator of protease activity HflC (stomatin/prohibitin superfamily)
MLLRQFIVNDNERAIVSKNGRFVSILSPGTYWLTPLAPAEIESYDLRNPVFRSRWEDYVVRERFDIVAAHFTMVETNDSEIAMIFVDGSLYQVLLPGKRVLFWKDAALVSAEVVSIIDSELPEGTLARSVPDS